MINKKLINKINKNLISCSVNEANTNTGYDMTQVVSCNLSFATPNNNSTLESPITPQAPLKDSEIPITKSIPYFPTGFIIPTKKTMENAETNSSEKKS